MPKPFELTRMRRGDWIQTFTGRQFWPLDPEPEDFAVEDIAHALSLICRFGGHTNFHYSVAQHSLLVSKLCPPDYALEGLLHDAAEAYLADVPRPIKHDLGGLMASYLQAEKQIERALADRFRLTYPWPDIVKYADNVALATEKRDVMKPEPAPWADLPPPHDVTIPSASSRFVEASFLSRLSGLLR